MRCTKTPCNRFPSVVHAPDSSLCDTLRIAALAADTDDPVLLTGETGTGKDVLAQAIHSASSRAGRSFTHVNCSRLHPETADSELFGVVRNFPGFHHRDGREGEFDRANHGTIFLNEIGDCPIECQPKLHQVLDNGELVRVGGDRVPIDVRVISATLLPENIRGDLKRRIDTFTIDVPPLRSRKGDIAELANRFADGKRILPEVYSRLFAHDWPANVGELRKTIRFALASSRNRDEITSLDLPPSFAEPRRRAQRLRDESITALRLDDVSATFPFSPGLILPEIVSENHAWRRELGVPAIVIVDDHAANRKNYQVAAAYLKERLQLRSGIQNLDLSIDVISPDELKVNFALVYQRLKSCVLLVLDLDFSDARLWKNGFVLMGYSVAACPWLRDSVLWVTQTGEDVFQETYLREAMEELQMCPDLAPRAGELLSGPIYAHPAIIQGRPRRPIPPYGPNLEPGEAEWWWSLGGHMGEILGNQKRAIGLWLNDQEAPISGAAPFAQRDGAESIARQGPSPSSQDAVPEGPLSASTVVGWILNEIEDEAPTTAILQAFVAVWNQHDASLRTRLIDSSWEEEFRRKLATALMDKKLQLSRGQNPAAARSNIDQRVRNGWNRWRRMARIDGQ